METRNVIALVSLIIVCISLISSVVALTTNMQNKLETHADLIDKLTKSNEICADRLYNVEKRNDIIDVKLTQIQTDLTEIKVDIKKINTR